MPDEEISSTLTSPSRAGAVGMCIGGRYALVELIGEGGMGRVWRCRDTLLDRHVAAKEVVLPHGLSSDEMRRSTDQVVNEARMAARLKHVNVVTVYDVIEDGGAPWIIMEFVAGTSLAAYLKKEGRIPWPRAREICLQIAAALAHAHEHGVVHRDLKPGNILLDGHRVWLTDFGIARELNRASARSSAGTVIGTPPYMAPEQWEGGKVTPKIDMWAFGAILFQMVEGRLPFAADSLRELLAAVLIQPAPAAPHAGPLARLISALLEKSPQRRPSARTALAELRARANPAPRRDRKFIAVATAICTIIVSASLGGAHASVPDAATVQKSTENAAAEDDPLTAPAVFTWLPSYVGCINYAIAPEEPETAVSAYNCAQTSPTSPMISLTVTAAGSPLPLQAPDGEVSVETPAPAVSGRPANWVSQSPNDPTNMGFPDLRWQAADGRWFDLEGTNVAAADLHRAAEALTIGAPSIAVPLPLRIRGLPKTAAVSVLSWTLPPGGAAEPWGLRMTLDVDGTGATITVGPRTASSNPGAVCKTADGLLGCVATAGALPISYFPRGLDGLLADLNLLGASQAHWTTQVFR
ncbi:MAG TPA: serine/threonine-protein kinase [Actinospica sp.]|nr:serine/threonine-protein kinase [Actinospica sp.]